MCSLTVYLHHIYQHFTLIPPKSLLLLLLLLSPEPKKQRKKLSPANVVKTRDDEKLKITKQIFWCLVSKRSKKAIFCAGILHNFFANII